MLRVIFSRLLVLMGAMLCAPSWADEVAPTTEPVTAEQIKFFEQEVRPVLIANCTGCHGAEKQKGDLRLDSLAAILTGGESGAAIIPRKPSESLLVEAINHQSLEMPPDSKLAEKEIAALTRWIEEGAYWPGDQGAIASAAKKEKITAEDRTFWSFQPLAKVAPPQLADDHWSRGAIDPFILDRLRKEGLQPAPEAPAEMLVRRLYFDLTGLPPTEAELRAYLADTSPNKYETLVDHLLASPQYGQHWARHWLDLVRYADSDGYKQDAYRPHAWRYRDYVIQSFNEDKPYDQFVREQLAGDEIAPNNPEVLAATGYLRMGIYEYNAKDARTQWNFILDDITDVTADVFLGMGMSCARCHDHKFDPILQVDYFRLRAFFAPIALREDIPLATPEVVAKHAQEMAAWNAKAAPLLKQLEQLQASKRHAAAEDELGRFPADVQLMVRKDRALREPLEHQLADLAWRQVEDKMSQVNYEASFKNDPENLSLWKHLGSELAQLQKEKPAVLPVAYTVTDVGPVAPACEIPANRRGETKDIAPGYLTILDPEPAAILPIINNAKTTGRRTALANWIARPDHPLTSRVIVNRLWQQHFGRGLVSTTSDFGKLGDRPSHPELLDYLAAQFVESGWKLKTLHRLMVTSATYRQTSAITAPEQAKLIDPANRLLWKMNSRRLHAEQIRDAMLVTSGEADLSPGGEGVDASNPRRSIYTKVFRNKRDPLLEVFDVADGLLTTPQRNVTTTATQALLMINSDHTLKRANAWAKRLKQQTFANDLEMVQTAYRTAFSRLPSDSEANAAIDYLNSLPREQSLVDFCHALLNANEFLYVD